jgi:pimeloyl-ACP methyl ester carboxylesterase
VRPETHFARSGDVSIAYQVLGEGPVDLVFVPGYVSHVELRWTVPSFASYVEQLASGARLILFDKRGTGMSDRIAGAPTLEERMDDLRAVMDTIGCARAALFGVSEGAPMSILFAATYPERTAALVLRGGFARMMWAPDYPWGRTEEQYRVDLDDQLRIYGPRALAEERVRALGDWHADDIPAITDYLRWSSSPGALGALVRMNREIDVRGVLPAVSVPTMVIHGEADANVPVEAARFMAAQIPGARFVEIPRAGHMHFGRDTHEVHQEIRRFVAAAWDADQASASRERVLATLLFTDIARATELAAELGDRAWRELLERHHAVIRAQLTRYRGAVVDTAGDGFFASFDGPARAISCACAVVEAVEELGLTVRAGVHTGECEVVEGKVAGIAVHTGARVMSVAEPGQVVVSSTVKDLVAGSGIEFENVGTHELKGVPGEWKLYSVSRGSA